MHANFGAPPTIQTGEALVVPKRRLGSNLRLGKLTLWRMRSLGLAWCPHAFPKSGWWIASVGSGEKALAYLGPYLYRGMVTNILGKILSIINHFYILIDSKLI